MAHVVKQNARVHDAVSAKYEETHGEIFNVVEQERLSLCLKQALTYVETAPDIKVALDYGCGSGNLTRHLLGMNLRVVSADISRKFLTMITQRYNDTGRSNTLVLNGKDLSGIGDNQFDFVGVYSVLHHVPDYLPIIREMIRVLRPGGIIYMDHEANESYWAGDQ
jgi:2-polyprenyl-3-methyl-5-hydroxy-6-metoxy-1,4-benzoquinol methylase